MSFKPTFSSNESNQNDNIKTAGSQFRLKRSIGSTVTPNTTFSSGMNAQQQQAGSSTGGGLLFPYLKHLLYSLHLVYEECKLHRSLERYSKSLIQVQYLLANELNLPLYMTYYESEHPFLLKLKLMKIFTSAAATSNSGQSSHSITLNLKNTTGYLSYILTQEPPVLHKFLLKLIEDSDELPSVSAKPPPVSPNFNLDSLSSSMSYMDTSSEPTNPQFINPFPIIGSVTKRIIKTIKIYALIALCTKSHLRHISYNEFLNQLFIKINFSGFQQQQEKASPSSSTASLPNETKDLKNAQMNSSQIQSYFNQSIKFSFKPGEKFIYENIFSLCLEMGLCTLNELYDFPFCVLFPVLEAIHWSRENPNLSWPSYAFDLIGRNDLTILKINSDVLASEQQLQQKNTTLTGN